MTERSWAALPLILVMLLLGWLIRTALATGTMSSKGAELRRADGPIRFWFMITLYAVLMLVLLGFIVTLVMR